MADAVWTRALVAAAPIAPFRWPQGAPSL
jgi:cytochrome b involved in lipid metabolism